MSRILRCLLVVVAAAALARGAAAQELVGTWFKLTVKASGYSVDPVAETTKKAKVKVVAYLQLTTVPADGSSLPGDPYGFELWCETSPDVWEVVDSSSVTLETVDGINYFLTDFDLASVNVAGQAIDGYCTDLIKVKRDKEGNIKSASYKTLGGEALDGTTNGDDSLRGGQTRSGKMVPVEKLPFTPIT